MELDPLPGAVRLLHLCGPAFDGGPPADAVAAVPALMTLLRTHGLHPALLVLLQAWQEAVKPWAPAPRLLSAVDNAALPPCVVGMTGLEISSLEKATTVR